MCYSSVGLVREVRGGSNAMFQCTCDTHTHTHIHTHTHTHNPISTKCVYATHKFGSWQLFSSFGFHWSIHLSKNIGKTCIISSQRSNRSLQMSRFRQTNLLNLKHSCRQKQLIVTFDSWWFSLINYCIDELIAHWFSLDLPIITPPFSSK